MTGSPDARPFLVIGENIHASRAFRRDSPRLSTLADGRPALRFEDERGVERLLPVPEAALAGPDGPGQQVKHVRAAVLAGVGDDPAAAELGRGYIRSLALRQARAGAHWLDLNVDEVTTDGDARAAAMAWLVGVVRDAGVPLAIDSSSSDILRAGLAAVVVGRDAVLLNSAGPDRLDVLDLATRERCAVVLSAAGTTAMPASAAERVTNATGLIGAAIDRGLPLQRLFVDPLVLPVAMEPDAGAHYLEAVRSLRSSFGEAIHLTGGLSNVSFGLPARRLLNDVFIDLAVRSGVDSGIIDPVASEPRRALTQDRTARAYRLASDVLTGEDPYAGAFLAAFRSGELR